MPAVWRGREFRTPDLSDMRVHWGNVSYQEGLALAFIITGDF